MERWVNKIAVVTGASSGIGAAIAKDLADRGVIVVALARRMEKLLQLADTTQGKIHAKQCDLQKEAEIISVFRWVESVLGGVDILVNNAAALNTSTLMTGETEKWQEIYDTNVKGVNICTREALKSMRQRGDNGHIFNINSIAGKGVPNIKGLSFGVYSSSKFALTSITEALRLELIQANSNIKITGIYPGAVLTAIATPVAEGLSQEMKKEVFMDPKKILRPEDISEALLYALKTKPNVQVHEIVIQPIGQTLS